ncbi:hypothetical protein F5Y00DRAFT_239581 [Daldinia vernicosa]|uniref:uncharacterized protein n=1 Tax=Daldinia vernicosa TaxID=114800 RepID=UPI00200741B1|nr:uncharacterized protein F5Y00DRAFT_239581 [Daldinia vernicosa]KAI0848006.1 hypothetical protein F5Y00DRAFT_239581 [Daldinia vernicosa]
MSFVGSAQGPRVVKRSRLPQRRRESDDIRLGVLILQFSYVDLKGLNQEAKQVKEAFESMGYLCEIYKIPNSDSQNKAEEKVRTFLDGEGQELRIVYYHGHGGYPSHSTGLEFSSHNIPTGEGASRDAKRFRDAIESALASKNWKELEAIRDDPQYKRYDDVSCVQWDPIAKIIMESDHEVLVILDCCMAGGASLSLLKRAVKAFDNKPRKSKAAKELIAATGWWSDTDKYMSPALCSALRKIGKDRKSIPELVLMIDEELAEKTAREKQELSKKRNELDRKWDLLNQQSSAADRGQLEDRETQEKALKWDYLKLDEEDRQVSDEEKFAQQVVHRRIQIPTVPGKELTLTHRTLTRKIRQA